MIAYLDPQFELLNDRIKALDKQFDSLNKRIDELFVKLREDGPGQIECPKCRAVKKTGDYVFRPGDNYTVCPNCHAPGVIKVTIGWHNE